MLAMSEARSPSRTCVGCQESADPEELVRFVLGPSGELAPVLSGAASGRGAWVHARRPCLEQAARRGFKKAFKCELESDARALAASIAVAAERRVRSLISAALGAKALAVGSQATLEALSEGRASLLIVASDAESSARSREVVAAIAAGRACAWGTKAELGKATRRDATGIVAVTDPGLARALARTIDWAHLSGTFRQSGRIQVGTGDSPTEE